MSVRDIVELESPPAVVARTPDPDPVAFHAHLQGDAVLVCSGDLDPAASTSLRRSLRRLVRLAPDRVVIDLSRVPFFDASAIGEFARARNSTRAAGGDLVVRAPSALGRRLLGVVGLTNLIDDAPGGDPAPGDVPAAELAGRFVAANESSVVVDEAKGLVAEHFDVGIDEASVMLRAFAIAQQQSVVGAAGALVHRTVDVARLAPLRPGYRAATEGDAARAAGRTAASGT